MRPRPKRPDKNYMVLVDAGRVVTNPPWRMRVAAWLDRLVPRRRRRG